ncbi:MAG TPA: sulfotransferase [Dokdonella sp.]
MSKQSAMGSATHAGVRNASAWLDRGRSLVLGGDLVAAIAAFREGLAAEPGSIELRHALAGVLWQSGHAVQAEQLLRALLVDDPDHAAATFLLAQILAREGRMGAVESVVCTLFAQPRDTGLLIHAIETLDDAGRKQAAASLVEAAIARGSSDPRLHAYAGMLAMQLGEFERARERYRYALDHDPRAIGWQSAYGYAMCKRYAEADDADFALLRGYLARPDLDASARASVLFALGKASDDVGDFARAAAWLREANALARSATDWSRKNWRRLVAARADMPVSAIRAAARPDFVPVFVVGLPRAGTTLVADRLARHPATCNRGELNWIAQLARELGQAARPSVDALERAVDTYVAQVRQDDTPARFFIDKQPLNFLHIEYVLAMFPHARLIHCRRNARDTALSIWMQHFAGREMGFAYDFADIAAVEQGSARLTDLARKRHPDAIRELRYEVLVQDPQRVIADLVEWIGLSPVSDDADDGRARVISTASAWQVRQPVHARSIGRWRAYAPHVPELAGFDDG